MAKQKKDEEVGEVARDEFAEAIVTVGAPVSNAAKAAGASLVLDILRGHTSEKYAVAYIESIGGVQNSYTGSDPRAEMLGIDEVLAACRKGTGMPMGNAPTARNEVQARIDGL